MFFIFLRLISNPAIPKLKRAKDPGSEILKVSLTMEAEAVVLTKKHKHKQNEGIIFFIDLTA